MSGGGGCQEASPLRRRLSCGGCSWVEYQQIGAWWHGPVSEYEPSPLWGCCSGKRPGWVAGQCLAHCWVLRQQDHGAGWFFPSGEASWWCGFVCFWFPCHDVPRMFDPFEGFVCGVCGVGLLFENYIVDASILYKKQFPR